MEGVTCVCGKSYKSENAFYKKHLETCDKAKNTSTKVEPAIVSTKVEPMKVEKAKKVSLAEQAKGVSHGLTPLEYASFIAGVSYLLDSNNYINIIGSIDMFEDKDFVRCIKATPKLLKEEKGNEVILTKVKALAKKISPSYLKVVIKKESL